MTIQIGVPAKADEAVAGIMGCDDGYAGAILHMWDLIQKHKGTLVFVNTRSSAEDIAFRLRLYLKDPPIQVHHGSLSRDARESAEKDFKAGKVKALICTSSLELGIDIGSADLVLQFNSPRQINKLIQRVGRSGHSLEKISLGNIVCSDIIELEEASAIVSYIMEGHLEDIAIRENSLATMANQVLSEAKFVSEIDADYFFQVVTRSYPFRNLSREEFDSTLDFLARTGKIFFQDGRVRKRRGVLNYFLENISMIPSEKNFKVIDQINRKFIGTLDERYVVNELEPGSYFVIRGSTWRTIRIDKDRILVEPFPTAAIAPKWSGEEIPVLLDVTEKVSQNRENRYVPDFVEENSRQLLEDWYSKDSATMKRTVIETKANEIIVQVLLGTKGNFALAEIFSSILSGITGESVETDYSPYHFYIRSSRVIRSNDVRRIILSIDPDRLYQYISGSARRSRFFNSVFLYEARKFGLIANDADIGRDKV
jgi:ATP-dependent Lhr-like helicase